MRFTKLANRVRQKNLMTWLPGYARHLLTRGRVPELEYPRHLLFAICDHYEPLWGDAQLDQGLARVAAWEEQYPRLARQFRDSDGRPPRHSFFFPGEQYQPESLEALARLARAGLGEVELHLHHDGDTSERLRRDIAIYLRAFAEHGHLARDSSGRLRFAFIHGNWCLANARRDGRWCGVDDELALLFTSGCYADFTFPAAPDESQPGIVNQIYWPTGDLSRRRAYESGKRARVGETHSDRILMVEGPLAPARRPGRLAVRIENGDLRGNDPPTRERLNTWVAQGICVAGRPEWVFVKVHTHGAPESNREALLGEPAREFHRALAQEYGGGRWRFHYVTAREMYNVAMAAMAGKSGEPAEFFDYILPPPAAVADRYG
jgi:hypothetical protein